MICSRQTSNRIYPAVALVSFSTLAYEILLTRIFSVTMWNHLAFFAISIAMFGITLGGAAVFIWSDFFSTRPAGRTLAVSALASGAAMVAGLLTHLALPYDPRPSLVSAYSLLLTFGTAALPFFFSGICICLALSTAGEKIGARYAADLVGGALGCLAVGPLLNAADGPTAIIAAAGAAAAAALLFMPPAEPTRIRRTVQLGAAALAMFAVCSFAAAVYGMPVVRINWSKGLPETGRLYEKWNAFSRVSVKTGHPLIDAKQPFGWGLSDKYTPGIRAEHLWLDIDSGAGTPITKYNHQPAQIDHLRYDVSAVAHHLRGSSRVLIIGAGGGIDILSALAFNQAAVTAVEINPAIVEAVHRRFGAFSGSLAQNPKVKLVVDEARSFVERSNEDFDIIQISMIDTLAATTAGAFVLTEHLLYTVEAWQTFLRRLSSRGILSVSRWYDPRQPIELYRTARLAYEALERAGAPEPHKHIAIVVNRTASAGAMPPLATLLAARQPFAEEDIRRLRQTADAHGFEILFAGGSSDAQLTGLLSAEGRRLAQSHRFDISAPADNKPFFFYMFKLQSLFNADSRRSFSGDMQHKAVFTLYVLLFVVLGAAYCCLRIPLQAAGARLDTSSARLLTIFFAAIGFGFMLFEVSQMQRLIIYLGHPSYALTVILFSLLLGSSVGSWATRTLPSAHSGRTFLFLLFGAIVVFGLLSPWVISFTRGWPTDLRICLSGGALFTLGMFLGTAFPLGMKLASEQQLDSLAPWLWSVNGAASVCAAVGALIIALSFGFSAAFWSAAACYAAAGAAFVQASKKPAAEARKRDGAAGRTGALSA